MQKDKLFNRFTLSKTRRRDAQITIDILNGISVYDLAKKWNIKHKTIRYAFGRICWMLKDEKDKEKDMPTTSIKKMSKYKDVIIPILKEFLERNKMQKNDRKAEQDKKGSQLEKDREALIQAIDKFNAEYGYDYELTRKTQTKKYRSACTILKSRIDDICDSLEGLHPWLK